MTEKSVNKWTGLNRDSTHPNPWRPPNEFNKLFGIYFPYQIYKGNPEFFKPRSNMFADQTFGVNLYIAFKKSFLLSSAYSYFTMLLVTKERAPREILGRMIFTVVPITSMAVSYVATKEIFSQIAMKNGFDREHNCTYLGAAIAPSLIYGAWKGSVARGIPIAFYASIFGVAYNELCRLGMQMLFPVSDSKMEIGEGHTSSTEFPVTGWKVSSWSVYEKNDPGPRWKKFED